MTNNDDVVWLDDENEDGAGDEDIVDTGRPPLHRRTKLVVAAVVAIAVVAAVIVGVNAGDDESTPTAKSTPPATTTGTATATAPVDAGSVDPPGPVVAAVRTVFASAVVTSFVTVQNSHTSDTTRIYNLRAGIRLLTVTVSPASPHDIEKVDRTTTSFEIAQRLGHFQVDLLLRTEDKSTPTAADYAGLQSLVLDSRLLATTGSDDTSAAPLDAPAAMTAAVRAAYPDAYLSEADVQVGEPAAHSYQYVSSGRRLSISVGPRDSRPPVTTRTRTSLVIVRVDGSHRIALTLRVYRGSLTAHDVAVVTALARDPRLLATR